jgi:hypothetical protein
MGPKKREALRRAPTFPIFSSNFPPVRKDLRGPARGQLCLLFRDSTFLIKTTVDPWNICFSSLFHLPHMTIKQCAPFEGHFLSVLHFFPLTRLGFLSFTPFPWVPWLPSTKLVYISKPMVSQLRWPQSSILTAVKASNPTNTTQITADAANVPNCYNTYFLHFRKTFTFTQWSSFSETEQTSKFKPQSPAQGVYEIFKGNVQG